MAFLEILRTAFKGGGGTRAPLARSFTSPWAFAMDGGGARAPFDYVRAVPRAFLANPVAQRCVRIVADGVGSAPLRPTDTALAQLVGATSAGQALLETLAANLLLHGNAFVQVMRGGDGKPVELFALRPDRMSVVPGPDGWPAAWQYKVGERVITLPIMDEDGWPQVIHLKAFHPTDDHYGAGCLAAADALSPPLLLSTLPLN